MNGKAPEGSGAKLPLILLGGVFFELHKYRLISKNKSPASASK